MTTPDGAVELVDSHQACNDPAGRDSDDRDDAQHEYDVEHDTSSSHIAVDTANSNEAAELDAIALLAGTWDVDLMSNPGLGAQLVQAIAQAYLPFGSGKGQGKGKRRAHILFALRTYHWKTVVHDGKI